ncbi:membrane hypothetical protein [Gammaproteobacteria bacterium]
MRSLQIRTPLPEILSRPTLALIFGIVGAAAALFVFVILGSPIGNGWAAVPVFAGVSAAAAGALIWPPFFRRRTPTVVRGAIAGGFIALLAYPLTWYLFFVSFWVLSFGTFEHDQIIPPWAAISASFVYSAWGIFLTGWLVVPVASIVGGLLALVLRRKQTQVTLVDGY